LGKRNIQQQQAKRKNEKEFYIKNFHI
jgi:hypothetical protein